MLNERQNEWMTLFLPQISLYLYVYVVINTVSLDKSQIASIYNHYLYSWLISHELVVL